MSKQYNKVEKRRRRQAYIERHKAKAKTAGKGVARKAKRPAKKKAAEPAA